MANPCNVLLQRTLHPVGQGGFFTEQFFATKGPVKEWKLYNVVYDCGSRTKGTNHSAVVTPLATSIKKTFKKDSEIDLLFVSHFDEDHINGLPITVEGNMLRVKHLVLPFLSNSQRLMIALSGCVMKFDDASLKERFNADKLTYIRQIGQNNNVASFQYSGPSTVIDSGTPLRETPADYFWEYIPYNVCDNSVFDSFLDYLLENHPSLATRLRIIDNEDLIDDIEDIGVITKQEWESIKECYRNFDGVKRNDSSLIVYSGPIDTPDKKPKSSWQFTTINAERFYNSYGKNYYWLAGRKNRVAALYTGDINLNYITVSGMTVVEYISQALKAKLDLIGSVQIPHHGSKHNFDPNVIPTIPGAFSCFYAYGTNNQYGHPFVGIRMMMMAHHKSVFEVTERPETEVVQIIELK